jgi:hypothetical protein
MYNPLPYIKRKILLDYLGKKDHGLLYKEQKGICLCCNKNLLLKLGNDDIEVIDIVNPQFDPSHREK